MFKKGLIFRREKEGTFKFGALPFVPGIFEQQSEGMDKTLAALYEGYFKEVFHRNLAESEPHLIHRPIPVNRSIDISYPMAVYDNSREIVRNQELIAVAKCICRVQKGAIHEGCQMPLETCFMFGSQAQYYMDRGTGRRVNVDEALEIMDRCEEAGLVTMPFNTMTPANICNCCSDCCVVLGPLQKHPRPVEIIKPGFHASVDSDRCSACETCLERCPMDAIVMGTGDKAEVNLDRCIGCGLCVNTCPEEAIHLEAKPEHERVLPPKTGAHTLMEIAQGRQATSPSKI
jgi:electron transport complex protein RnfB